ncbi:hypothetical protein LU631_02740 [Erwinia tracheiphila]|uniref:Uncharacterized protein n=1 Tax=Erwinia tracheiphila TaxID=65700 RepID=A0A0M2KJ43_9GAMM|nr:hypothetical protein [Erwinia tracheiphila]EOS94779.1 hypothetical protein ETR_12033 [Erwinia tracheiphila PSU-1]KKF37016.1 hypothetical protein SY86_18810 [Erwinia tracheiphila]UIA88365.1 hypothetical protein LU631_02740 [Erwinia tracheiphila]UIA96214.1 hypothetical protein LU633_23420 [Erwinia tracheiphila]
MIKKTIALSLLVSINAFAYELPVDGKGGYIDECNNYANKKSDIFIKEHNIKFKPYSLHVGEKITEDKDWNETSFKTSLSAVCAMGHFYAKGNKGEADSVKWTLQSNSYDTMYQSVAGDVRGEDLVLLIKNAVIFGRDVK